MSNQFKVTKKALRPASKQYKFLRGKCFYCKQKIGKKHLPDCVLVKQRAVVKVEIIYEVDIPAYWGKNEFEFHRNMSTSCANNTIDDIKRFMKSLKGGCLCGRAQHTFVRQIGEVFLCEN